tara:strand:+ start:905 stop:2755 length:1851 start_codon:yes stop_codon:yes gene_type:complete
MAGAVKRRIRRMRSLGKEEMALWLEAREEARAKGLPLWRWEKENPKPEGDDSAPSAAEISSRKNSVNYYKDTTDLSEVVIPEVDQVVLDKIVKNKQVLKEKAVTASPTELRTIYKVLKRLDNEEKKIRYRYDFKAFDEDFFNDLQDRVPTADFHFEMVGLYKAAPRACVVCPRGHAKSTTARKYLLHQILYKMSTYIIIVGASEEMAAQNLRWVRDQLTDNDALIDVFGFFKNKDKWADTEFQTNTGIKVSAKGAGQKIRGANEKGRPDLIYIDDLEEDEQVSSKDRRAKLAKWFTQALLPCKSRGGRVIITGTILHMDSLLQNISENKVKDHINWQVLWYSALTKDSDGNEHALWPQHKPLRELQKLREIDPETFAQEYQNNPSSGAMAVFSREEYKYIEQSDINIAKNGDVLVKGKKVNVLMTSDLAVSEREGADYTVFMMTGMDDASNLYVLETMRFRSSDPYEQINIIFEMLNKWCCDTMTMEKVAFQATFKRILEKEMADREKFFFIHVMSRSNVRKIFRIKSLKAPIRSGHIFWQTDDYVIEEELSQVTATSLGTRDDVIDALADAWEVQIEMTEDAPASKYEVNTLEWCIENGGFITTDEQDEQDMMYD